MSSTSIISDARGHINAWRQIPFPAANAPSEHWKEVIAAHHEKIIHGMSADELVARVTGENVTTEPRTTDDREFKKILAGQQRWLERFGRPLHSFPSFVQESTLTAPSVVTTVDGRRLSTAFLYHLSIAAQIQTTVGKLNTVFELGSGYGGLARVLKLLNPEARFVLCDLPETLYLCYVFLRRHFPNCSFEAIERREQLASKAPSADFTFVPAQLASELEGTAFDVAVNTCSLSEMTQSAAEYYVGLIENSLKVDYFYHLNRLANPKKMGNVCTTSFGLDRHWEVLKWQWRGEDNFFNTSYPQFPFLLNLIARRIPERLRSDVLYAGMAASLRARVTAAKVGSDEWHAAMWQLIRVERRRSDIETYLKVIRPAGWIEASYYDSMLASAN